MNLSKYHTIFLDCDGVIIDSNPIKTEAFRKVAEPYGPHFASELVEYHTKNGGVSRFKKFEYFFSSILKRVAAPEEMTACLGSFEKFVQEGLSNVAFIPGFFDFLKSLPQNLKPIILSGAAQTELERFFSENGLVHSFHQILGSPQTKREHLISLNSQGIVSKPALFIGDSKYDYEVAKEFDLEFIFMSGYTEFHQWEKFFLDKNVALIKDFRALLL